MVFGIGTVNAQNVLNEMDSTCTKGQGDGY